MAHPGCSAGLPSGFLPHHCPADSSGYDNGTEQPSPVFPQEALFRHGCRCCLNCGRSGHGLFYRGRRRRGRCLYRRRFNRHWRRGGFGFMMFSVFLPDYRFRRRRFGRGCHRSGGRRFGCGGLLGGYGRFSGCGNNRLFFRFGCTCRQQQCGKEQCNPVSSGHGDLQWNG
jgi:hypothetical protein